MQTLAIMIEQHCDTMKNIPLLPSLTNDKNKTKQKKHAMAYFSLIEISSGSMAFNKQTL